MRTYKVDGKDYPSVTSLLHEFLPEPPELTAWKNRTSNWRQVLKDAGTRGTAVHGLIEEYMHKTFGAKHAGNSSPQGITPEMQSEIDACFELFKSWRSEHEFKPLDVEISVVSKIVGYAGTADCIAVLDGEVVLIDWKTSSYIYETQYAQLMAYKKALIENKHPNITDKTKCVIVKMNARTGLEACFVPNEESAWQLFLTAVNNYKRFNNIAPTSTVAIKKEGTAMTTRAELRANRRIRVALEGPRGTGKTTSMVGIAKEYVEAGHLVLYLDLGTEEGASEELEGLSDEVLAGIRYIQMRTFADYMTVINEKRWGAIIVDAGQNLRSIAAEVTTNVLISTGTDTEDDVHVLQKVKSQHGIAHPSVLSWGKGTGLLKEYERAFFDFLWDTRADIIFGINTKSLSASENYAELLGGMFDLVLELGRAQEGDDWAYRFRIEKVRGVSFVNAKWHRFNRGENIVRSAERLAGKTREIRKPDEMPPLREGGSPVVVQPQPPANPIF